MTPEQWDAIQYFDPSIDNFGNPDEMDHGLMLTLDAFRKYVGKPVIVHCGFERRDNGWHPHGMAVDIHIEGMSLIDQFLAAQRFVGFTGIGLYPWWKNKGLHVDNRPKTRNQPRSFWGSVSPGKYIPVTKQFLFQTL